MIQFLKGLLSRARGRHPLELLKFLEIELLGRHASTRCFHHPSHALIELTTRCNLRCRWCNQNDPQWQNAWGHQDMPFEVFEKIVSQLRGSRVLLLYNIGEPLLYKRIFDAVRLARRYIPEVRMTSNGLLLTPEIARNLQAAGLTRLNVSIDSPRPEEMAEIRGADLEKIAANLREFGEACSIPVEIWTVISQGNIESLKELPRWASRFPAVKSLYFQLQKGPVESVESGFRPIEDEGQFRDFQAGIATECERYGLRSNILSLPFYPPGFHQRQAEGICKAPFIQLMAINVRGEMAPCCTYGAHAIGSVADRGFAAVWNGPEMRAWRRDMLEQRYCAYCSEWCV